MEQNVGQSYSLIRQRQQYALAVTVDKNGHSQYLLLLRIEKLNIVCSFGIKMQQYWGKCCKNVLGIKNWFDCIDDLVRYIRQGNQNIIRVWVMEGRVDILVQPRKGKDKYVKIGEIQLQQVNISKKMQLQWLTQQCNKECLNEQQILYNVRNMYRIYLQLINMPVFASQQQQTAAFDFQPTLKIIEQLQKGLVLVQECMESEIKRIMIQYGNFMSQINARLQNCLQTYSKQAIGCKYQNEINKRSENAELMHSEMKNDIGNAKISEYVNTSAAYFKYFKTNQYQIYLFNNPTYKHSIMFCGYPIKAQIFKYSIKIIIMKRKIALGIANASSTDRRNITPNRQQMITYSNKGNLSFEKTITRKGKSFRVGDIVSVCVNFAEGTICWTANQVILFKYKIELLKMNQMVWMPYIQLINQGDTVQWIVD